MGRHPETRMGRNRVTRLGRVSLTRASQVLAPRWVGSLYPGRAGSCNSGRPTSCDPGGPGSGAQYRPIAPCRVACFDRSLPAESSQVRIDRIPATRSLRDRRASFFPRGSFARPSSSASARDGSMHRWEAGFQHQRPILVPRAGSVDLQDEAGNVPEAGLIAASIPDGSESNILRRHI